MALPMEDTCAWDSKTTSTYRRGEPATGNAQLVKRVVRLPAELGRPVATPAEARRLPGLGGRDSGRREPRADARVPAAERRCNGEYAPPSTHLAI